jgi:hypothetical protein
MIVTTRPESDPPREWSNPKARGGELLQEINPSACGLDDFLGKLSIDVICFV